MIPYEVSCGLCVTYMEQYFVRGKNDDEGPTAASLDEYKSNYTS